MTLKKKEAFAGILFILPFLAGFLVFYIIPFGISVFYSFTQGIGGMTFVGMKNYRDVLGSYAFQLAAANTFRFMGIGIPLIILVSLGLSLILFGSAGHTKFFQSVFLYPMVIPIGSVVMFFQVMLSEYGVVNRVLYQLGLKEVKWLDSSAALTVLLFLYVWKNCGYNIVLFLTGLNAIPKECEEAAKLDGAGRWQYFRYIQCPLLIPSFLFVFVMSVINSFKCYREAYLLGGRYPNDSIYMLQHFMNNNFESLNYQRLSVAAILVFLIIFAMVILLFAGKYRTEQDGTGKKRRRRAGNRSEGRGSALGSRSADRRTAPGSRSADRRNADGRTASGNGSADRRTAPGSRNTVREYASGNNLSINRDRSQESVRKNACGMYSGEPALRREAERKLPEQQNQGKMVSCEPDRRDYQGMLFNEPERGRQEQKRRRRR